jgi:hypothetical protein
MLLTAGCLLLLSSLSGAVPLFGVATLVALPRSELTQPVPRGQKWMTSGVLVALVALVVAYHLLVPRSVDATIGRVVHHPAFVLPFWLLMLWSLFRIYRTQSQRTEGGAGIA